MKEKSCGKCNNVKPLSDFEKEGRVLKQCARCRAVGRKAMNNRGPKICKKCGNEKPRSQFRNKNGNCTHHCHDCRGEGHNWQKYNESRPGYNLVACPWESGQVKQLPFGGIM